MKWWEERAVKLLRKSLEHIPQELNELDWKADFSQKGDKIARHFSAFANYSEGGFLVFGVDNSGKKFNLDEQTCKDIVTKAGNIVRDGVEPPIAIEHSVIKVEGSKLLFIYIPESDTKPVHLRGQTIYESYTRSAGQTRKLSKQEVARSISSSTGLTFETKLATPVLSQGETLKRLDFTTYFELLDKPIPTSLQEVLEIFTKEKIVRKANDGFNITNLGAILLAKNLDDFEELKRKTVRIIQYGGKDRLNRKNESRSKIGYAAGFPGIIRFINTVLPSNEIIKRSLRKETKLYPELAVREIIANAMIHQDFGVVGSGPVIEIFEDRMEVRNPGRPLIQTERFLDHPPRSRNEMLASLMRRFGICEESGTGVDKMVAECEMYQLPAPSFIVRDDHLIATLYAPRSLTKMDKKDRIWACYLHACLRYVAGGEAITNTSVRGRFKISKGNYPLASKILKETLQKKLLKHKDPNNLSPKHAQYVPFWA